MLRPTSPAGPRVIRRPSIPLPPIANDVLPVLAHGHECSGSSGRTTPPLSTGTAHTAAPSGAFYLFELLSIHLTLSTIERRAAESQSPFVIWLRWLDRRIQAVIATVVVRFPRSAGALRGRSRFDQPSPGAAARGGPPRIPAVPAADVERHCARSDANLLDHAAAYQQARGVTKVVVPRPRST